MKTNFQINAWLERSDPLVEIRDTSDDLRLTLKGELLDSVLANMHLSLDELYSNKSLLNELLNELFSLQLLGNIGVKGDDPESEEKIENTCELEKNNVVDFPLIKSLIKNSLKSTLCGQVPNQQRVIKIK